MQILRELLQTGGFRLLERVDARCKNIIPGHLVVRLCTIIILRRLGLVWVRWGRSFDLARDLARSECLPSVSLENMTCASLSAWSP